MTKSVERMLPLYEGKMIHHYDHRWATYEPDGSIRDVTASEKSDQAFHSLPRYWVRDVVVRDRLAGRWGREWLIGWRDICRSTDERTMISTIIGSGASPEGGILLALPDESKLSLGVLAIWNSFIFDFVARQKTGGTHLKYFTVRQLPMLPLTSLALIPCWTNGVALSSWLNVRSLYLLSDSTDMIPLRTEFSDSIDLGKWSELRRRHVRVEIDAAMFHLYGIERDDVDYIMETFPIVRRKDEAAHGEYRTKRLILQVYDLMADAMTTGGRYESPFDEVASQAVTAQDVEMASAVADQHPRNGVDGS